MNPDNASFFIELTLTGSFVAWVVGHKWGLADCQLTNAAAGPSL